MHKTLKRRHITLSLVLAALVVGVAPATASAEIVIGDRVGSPGDACDGNNAENDNVKVCFQQDGEWLFVKDVAADGRSAYGEIENRDRICRNLYGQGTWVRCNYSFREGSAVTFRGYTKDNEGSANLIRNLTTWTADLA